MPSWTVDTPQRLSFDEPVARLDVNLVSGRLNVVGTDGPARVEITRVGRKPIRVEHRDGVLSVRQPRSSRWPGGFLWWVTTRHEVEVSIAVPATARAALRLVSGAVIASGLREDTTVDVTSGQVTLMGLGGHTVATLVSGPVEALGIVGDLTLQTVSGELVVADSPAERVRAETTSGAITCDLDYAGKSEIQLSAMSGHITARVRDDSDLSVRLQTTSGRITSAFPEVQADGPSWSRQAQGVLGGGAGKLVATTMSGSITLLARPAPDVEDT